jgi:hypothetical protein
VDQALTKKLDAYLQSGGSLIASYESGMNAEKSRFVLQALGVRKKSDGPLADDGKLARGRTFRQNNFAELLMPGDQIGAALPKTEHVIYIRGMDIEATAGDTLVHKMKPYFDRTWEHYVSHRQTPTSGKKGGPAVVRNGPVIYFSSPLFTQYQTNAPKWCKTMLMDAVELLLSEPLVKTNAPCTAQITLNHQPHKNRFVLHVLHYVPERRTDTIDVIEDVLPIFQIETSVHLPQAIRNVTLVPEGKPLPFAEKGGRIEFVVPEINGHQMIELSY